MLSSLLWVVLTQIVACTPGETSMVCNCKLGMVSACVTLVGEDTRKAVQVLEEVEVALEVLEQAAPMAGEWLNKNSEATPEEFMDKLREIYSRPEMKGRFPHGF